MTDTTAEPALSHQSAPANHWPSAAYSIVGVPDHPSPLLNARSFSYRFLDPFWILPTLKALWELMARGVLRAGGTEVYFKLLHRFHFLIIHRDKVPISAALFIFQPLLGMLFLDSLEKLIPDCSTRKKKISRTMEVSEQAWPEPLTCTCPPHTAASWRKVTNYVWQRGSAC